jgi:mannose-1-phosphate guanylyltransferase
MRGDRLPKQYVNFIGRRSMLEHTFSRAERLIDPRRIFTVVGRDHLSHPEARRQLSAREPYTVIVQPENKETAPGLLLPLAHLYRRYSDSAVAIFPSDHFIVEEELFMAHVDLACRIVERYPCYLALLGIEPQEPETDYGYILPGNELKRLAPLAVRPVLSFREKPDIHGARAMLAAGGLWNTMVMVCRAKTLVGLVRGLSPRLHGFFERIRLLVLPVRGVTWSDWGSERRLIGTLDKLGYAIPATASEEAAGHLRELDRHKLITKAARWIAAN